MNILFLTIFSVSDIEERGLYNDLMRTFRDHGHKVCIACPVERRNKQRTSLRTDSGIDVLRIKTLNFQKTNMIEKGLSTLLLEYQFFKGVKAFFNDIKFDLVLYSTPPITFSKVVNYIKNRDGASSYLLLKDIFPQNAVDLGMLKAGGLIHKHFVKKERELYASSDHIGCMSPANVQFIRDHHKELDPMKVELNPNSIIPLTHFVNLDDKIRIRIKNGIPAESIVFIYGGNLGKPQGIDFLIEVLQSNLNKSDRFFLIIGSGTEFGKLKKWHDENSPINCKILSGLPKNEYDEILQASDVGLIFLDKRFTIPNFPSRLLSYLECKIPVVAATDVNTDIGTIAEQNGFGYWCQNGDLTLYNQYLDKLCSDRNLMNQFGENGFKYLQENYTTENSYKIIMNHMSGY